MEGGEFEKQVKKIADGYWDVMEAKHYIVITQNYNIDIIAEWEPKIDVLYKNSIYLDSAE